MFAMYLVNNIKQTNIVSHSILSLIITAMCLFDSDADKSGKREISSRRIPKNVIYEFRASPQTCAEPFLQSKRFQQEWAELRSTEEELAD